MRGVSVIWFLGIRYLRRNRVKTCLLVAAFTLVFVLPPLVALVVSSARDHLGTRAKATPLLLGTQGSPLELVFNGLYFSKPDLATMTLGEAMHMRSERLADSIPIYARFRAADFPIVGTSLDYFEFRQLRIREGRKMIRLGECVIGADVADLENLAVGDGIVSSPEAVFDLAGVYPLRMKVCGILEKSGTADDRAIFVELKTAWIIEGLGHGHEEAEDIADSHRLPSEENGKNGEEKAKGIQLNASVKEYNEITAENAGRFHFHGDLNEFPVTASILLPGSAKNQAIVKARYEQANQLQLVSPEREMDRLFATVFRIQRVLYGIIGSIAIATLLIGGVVFFLSHRLREREFSHLQQLGAAPATMRLMIAFETLFVCIVSVLLAGGILLLAHAALPGILRNYLG